MKLIINADDLGMSKGVNAGIYDAHVNGVVTSTSLMTNMLYVEEAIDLFKGAKIGIGVHLNITLGHALKNHEFLTDEKGNFRGDIESYDDYIQEIEEEFIAQIEKAYKLGVEITHLDSHHHVHMRFNSIYKLVLKLAKKYALAIRFDPDFNRPQPEENIRITDDFLGSFFDENVQYSYLIKQLEQRKNIESLEIMVHPGFVDQELINLDSYQDQRVKEHGILTSDILKDYVKQNKIQMIHYKQL